MRTAAFVGRAAERDARLGTQIGDPHELLGLSFPRRFRYSRQHASHITASAGAASAFTPAASAACASAGDTACAAASDATCAATSDTACASTGDTARAAASNAACASAGAACAVRSAGWLFARHLARSRRGARC